MTGVQTCALPISFGDGIQIGNSSYNIISDNNVEDSDAHGIYVGSSSNNIILNNNVQDSGLLGIFVVSSSDNNVISANIVRNNSMDGILIRDSSNNNITGNIIFDNGNSYDGIKIGDSFGSLSNNNIVCSNHISNPSDTGGSGYGISIYSSAANNYIAGNYINDNDGQAFAAKINDAGTGTKYTGKEKITLERVTDSSSSVSPDASYIKITSGSITIGDGKSAGDILILEGPDTAVAIPSGNIRFCSNHTNHNLSANDTLILTWTNDTLSSTPTPTWLELSYTNN